MTRLHELGEPRLVANRVVQEVEVGQRVETRLLTEQVGERGDVEEVAGRPPLGGQCGLDAEPFGRRRDPEAVHAHHLQRDAARELPDPELDAVTLAEDEDRRVDSIRSPPLPRFQLGRDEAELLPEERRDVIDVGGVPMACVNRGGRPSDGDRLEPRECLLQRHSLLDNVDEVRPAGVIGHA